MLELERAITRRQPELSTIRNFLLLQYPLALGTAIHATPLIAALHAAIPDARIAAAASGFALDVLRGNPGLERLVPTPSPLHEFLPAARSLRKAHFFDREAYAVLLTTGNERSRIMLAAVFGTSPTRVGFTLMPELAAVPLRFDPRISQIANNLCIVAALGHGPALLEQLQANPALIEPAVYFSPSELDAARALCQEANPQGAPITAFAMQGSGGQRTGWHDHRFAQVIRHVESLGHRTVFLGTAADGAIIDRLRVLSGSSGVSLAGRTSVAQLTALLCLCDLLVTLDTGTMHAGRAAGLPMIVLGPSWQRPIEWLPLGKPNVRILRGDDRDDVPPDYRLDEISAADVIAAVDDLRDAYPPSQQERERRVGRMLSPPRPDAIA
jgi:ADP-heptose:LPS heptosyltransferase